jgi:hypothetical protein
MTGNGSIAVPPTRRDTLTALVAPDGSKTDFLTDGFGRLWSRISGVAGDFLGTVDTELPDQRVSFIDGHPWNPSPDVNASNQLVQEFNEVGIGLPLMSGESGNLNAIVFPSAARTATVNSSDIINLNCKGLKFWIDITVVPGSGSVTLRAQERDPASGGYNLMLQSVAHTTVGLKPTLIIYPGGPSTANVKANEPVPRVFRIGVVHATGVSYTYSVGMSLIR